MSEIVESLFGVSPERYRQQQDIALQREALAYAQLNPMQRAEAGIYAGARQLGSGIGRMLGGEDPGMRRVTEQDQIIRSINLNDPETYGPAAQRASQMGHTELAMKILQASDAAFQRRESQNIDEAFRRYGDAPAVAPAAPASIAPAPVPTQPNVGFGTTGVPGVGMKLPFADSLATRLNPTTGEVEPVPLRENQAAAGLFDKLNKTYSPVFGTLALTAPQILTRLNNKLAALTDNPPEGMTPQMRAEMIAATKEEIIATAEGKREMLTPTNAMAPQAAPSAAPAIGLESKLEKLISDRRIFASQRPTKPGDVNRVNNTIKGIDEEIKRLTELNSPLAKVIADRDKFPPGDPRRKPFDDFIEKETQLVDRTITIGNRVLDAKTMKVLYTAPDATPAAIAEFKAFEALPENEKKAYLELQKVKRPTPKIEITNAMPGDKNLADIPAFRASVQRTIEPQLKTITATEQALTAINDSLATSNFAAYRAAQVQFARAISGAGDLSQKELKAAGADPSLLGGTADYLSTVFSSTPTADTQKKIRSTLQAIQTVARKQAQGEVDQQKAMALRSPGYNPDAVNEALKFPQLQAEAAARAPIYAVNPDTKQRIMSTDGGSTWSPVR